MHRCIGVCMGTFHEMYVVLLGHAPMVCASLSAVCKGRVNVSHVCDLDRGNNGAD